MNLQSRIYSNLLLSMATFLLFVLWQEHCSAIPFNNTIVKCGGKNNGINKYCPHGGFIENPDPRYCSDKYFCYRALGETCNSNVEMRCRSDMICRCGRCQNCNGNVCNLELCPTTNVGNEIFKRLFKRLEKDLLTMNDLDVA